MYDFSRDNEPATEQQKTCLDQLGIHVPSELSQRDAQIMIESWIATAGQRACLDRLDVKPGRAITRYEASCMISKEILRRRRLPPTPRQERFLRNHGRWCDDMTRGEAFDLIGRIKSESG